MEFTIDDTEYFKVNVYLLQIYSHLNLTRELNKQQKAIEKIENYKVRIKRLKQENKALREKLNMT